MALDTPSTKHMAVKKTSSGISLAHGVSLAPVRITDPASAARDAAQQQHCKTTWPATAAAGGTASPQIRRGVIPATEPQNIPVMRRYDVASLGDNGEINTSRHVAPATPLFEAAFSAFARGTLLSTTQGLCAVEDLLPGMQVDTVEFGSRPVLWIGSMTILPDAPVESPDQVRMTRIMADTFGIGRPISDVMAGPGARLLHRPAALRELKGTGARSGQVLTPVADFEDGMSTIRITPPRPVVVYHLCLDRHASIKVSGLEMESFHPGLGLEQRMGPNALSLFLSLFPHITKLEDFGPLAHPRATRDTLHSLTAA